MSEVVAKFYKNNKITGTIHMKSRQWKQKIQMKYKQNYT